MLPLILEWLKETGHHAPAVFGYTSTRMMLAAALSLLLTIGFGPLFIRALCALKVGQNIRTDECPTLGKLHGSKKNTPTMGGLLILLSMVVSLVLFMDLSAPFTWILLFTTVSLGFLGGWDDYLKLRYKNAKGLSSRRKFLGQLLVAALIGLYLYIPQISEMVGNAPLIKNHAQVLTLTEAMGRLYIPFIKDPVWIASGLGLIAMFVLLLVVITGTSNAVNLTDGLDGLASGALVMTSSALALVAFLSNNAEIASFLNILYIEGSGEIAIYLCALAGSALGFLWYNSHPAQVFMGDTGSLALGGIIGVSAALLCRQFLLVLIAGLFVMEALSVILQVASYRLRNKKRIFACAPLHHHFEFKGWSESKVVVRFWIIALLFAIFGIASLKFQ